MQLEQKYRVIFSRKEVTEALKSHYPDRVPVQALPTTGSDTVTHPTMEAGADHLSFTWSRIAGAA